MHLDEVETQLVLCLEVVEKHLLFLILYIQFDLLSGLGILLPKHFNLMSLLCSPRMFGSFSFNRLLALFLGLLVGQHELVHRLLHFLVVDSELVHSVLNLDQFLLGLLVNQFGFELKTRRELRNDLLLHLAEWFSKARFNPKTVMSRDARQEHCAVGCETDSLVVVISS